MEPKSYEITIDGKLKVSLITLMIPKTAIDSNEQLFGCTHASCGQWFTTREAFVSHIKTHEMSDEMTGVAAVDTNNNQYMCRKCSKSFETHDQLWGHRTWAHILPLESDPPVIPINDNTPHKCMFTSCGQGFETLSEYHKHLDEIHRKYRCIVCDQRFIAEVLLEEHRYNCPPIQCLLKACGQRFQTFDELQRHLKEMHYKYNCNKCENSFASPELLLTHKTHCLLNKSVDTHHGSQDLNVSTDSLPKQTIDTNSVEMTVDGSHKTQTSETPVDVIDLTDDNEDVVITQESVNQTIARITVRVLFTCTHPSCGQSFVTLADYVLHINTHIITSDMTAAPVDRSVNLVLNDNTIDNTHEDITKKCSNVFGITRDSNACLPLTQTQDMNRYHCSFNSCNQWFKTLKEYQNHCIVSHKNGIISTARTILPKNDMIEDIAVSDANHSLFGTLYECRVTSCGQRFKTFNEFDNHLCVKLKCIECQKTFASPELLSIHKQLCRHLIRSVINQNVGSNVGTLSFQMKCLTDNCGQEFTDKSTAIKHMVNDHHIYTIYECGGWRCGQLFVMSDAFVEHCLRVHKLKIAFNDGVWTQKSRLLVEQHIDKSQGIKPYVCTHEGCGKRFPIYGHLRSHVKTSHSTIRFVCDYKECGLSFKLRKTLQTHKYRVHECVGQPKIKCTKPGCGRAFKHELTLAAHIKCVHSGREYRCDWPECDYRGRHEGSFREHVRKHTNEKPFACRAPGCEYRSHSNTVLWYHNRNKHTTDKPFACDWPACEYRCKYKVLLRQHAGTHGGAKPYACDWPACDYKCSHKSNLNLHQRSTHRTGKTYECDWPACKYNTYSTASLALHRSTHSNDKPVVCHWPGCEQRFRNNMSLNGHMYVHREPHLRCDINGCHYKTRYKCNLITHKKHNH